MVEGKCLCQFHHALEFGTKALHEAAPLPPQALALGGCPMAADADAPPLVVRHAFVAVLLLVLMVLLASGPSTLRV